MHANIKYELQELERLISFGELKPNREEGQDLNVREKVKNEVERIKQTLVYEVFSFEDERHLERYIQYHQQALIRLMDKAAVLLTIDNPGDLNQKNLFQIFYNALDELLSFVERHFTKYFDQDAKAPQGYISIARKEAKTNLKKLQKILGNKKADSRLIDLMLHVLKKIMDRNPEVVVTYRNVMYAKEVQKELFRLLENQSIEDINEELRQIMYYLNYNSTKVLTYHAHYISGLLDSIEIRAEKIEKLSFALKKINQAQVKPGIAYNQHASPLKSQLSNYITEELDYQERLQQLTIKSPGPPDDNLFQGFKLKFEASVSQLAYLIKVFMGIKLILNNNLTQILQFLVRFVITKKSETISYGSFRSKFYNVESGTKESVRNMLVTMINYIDKN
jgi:hypothetical protein